MARQLEETRAQQSSQASLGLKLLHEQLEHEQAACRQSKVVSIRLLIQSYAACLASNDISKYVAAHCPWKWRHVAGRVGRDGCVFAKGRRGTGGFGIRSG